MTWPGWSCRCSIRSGRKSRRRPAGCADASRRCLTRRRCAAFGRDQTRRSGKAISAHILPARARVRKVAHHAALPFDDLPGFLAALRGREGMAARALEFAILTVARTGEVLGARWGEIDLAAKIWTIPAERMKVGREHRVPLSDAALAVLENVRPLALMMDRKPDPAAPVFPGARRALPMSNMTMLMLLRRMKRDDLTAHGFRSTFSDWAAERTAYPREVVEMALAHTIESKAEAAYRRGDLVEKRRQLMEIWAQFCEAPNVILEVTSIRTAL